MIFHPLLGTVENKHNQEPDFDDPEWVDKVTDWTEFWNHQRWDAEVADMDDRVDAAGNDTRTYERVTSLIAAVQDARIRSDVINFLGPRVSIVVISVCFAIQVNLW